MTAAAAIAHKGAESHEGAALKGPPPAENMHLNASANMAHPADSNIVAASQKGNANAHECLAANFGTPGIGGTDITAKDPTGGEKTPPVDQAQFKTTATQDVPVVSVAGNDTKASVTHQGTDNGVANVNAQLDRRMSA
jgi:hypothetical protein